MHSEQEHYCGRIAKAKGYVINNPDEHISSFVPAIKMVASFQGRRRRQRGAIRRFESPAYATTVCFARPWAPEAAETDLERAGLVMVAAEPVRAEDVPAKAMAMAVAVMEVALVAVD